MGNEYTITKKAGIGDVTLPDMQNTFNKYTVNPLFRSLLLGSLGYLGGKYGYRYLTNKSTLPYIQMAYAHDPYMRDQITADFKREQERKEKMFGMGGAVLGGLFPFSQRGNHFIDAYKNKGVSGILNQLVFDKEESEKSNMSENVLTKYSDYYMDDNKNNDFLLGKDFVLPVVRPIEFIGDPDIPKASSIDLVQTQAPILGEQLTSKIVSGFDNAGDGRSGLISTMDIVKGLVRTGVGAVGGIVLGNVLGTILSQPASLKSKMANYGMIGGAILNSGVAGPVLNKVKGFLSK